MRIYELQTKIDYFKGCKGLCLERGYCRSKDGVSWRM